MSLTIHRYHLLSFVFLISDFIVLSKLRSPQFASLGYLFQEDTSTCWIAAFMQSLGLCYLSSLWSSSWLYCSFIELKSNFRGVASSVMLPLCCPSILWTLPCHFPWETFFSLPGPPLNCLLEEHCRVSLVMPCICRVDFKGGMAGRISLMF